LIEIRGITLALPDSYYIHVYVRLNSELSIYMYRLGLIYRVKGVTLVLPDSYHIHV